MAGSSIGLANLKVTDADIQTGEAELQKDKAATQFDHFDDLIHDGLNKSEWWALKALEGAAVAKAAAAAGSLRLITIPGHRKPARLVTS